MKSEMIEMKELISKFDGNPYDLCYELLVKYPNETETFEKVCKTYSPDHDRTIPIPSHFTLTEIQEYESLHGDMVNGLLYSTIKKCNLGYIAPVDFYNSLWQSICHNLTTLKEKAFAMYYTIIDKMIPYHYLGKPLSMTNEQYKDILQNNEMYIDRIKYIAKSNYSQRTEKASLLLNCLNEIENYEVKVVVLSQAITILGQSRDSRPFDIDTLLQKIDERIQELEDNPEE